MIVLGINDGHNASVCLLQDGRLIFYSAEERRLNIKNYPGIPQKSINAVLKQSGTNARNIDLVVLSSRIRTTVPTSGYKPIYSVLHTLSSLGRSEIGTLLGRWLLSRMRKRKTLLTCLADHGMANVPLVAFDHHLSHAASAYFHRPWQGDALVLTLDGAGDGLCATVNVGRGTDLHRIAQTPKFHSPAAWMFSAVTAHLGLKPYEHEYKVMGMAPYGRPEYCKKIFQDAFSVEDLKFRNHTGRIGPSIQRYYAKKLYGHRFDNISAACQLIFEEMMRQWVSNAVRATGIGKLACAGGAFLNVKANKLIREMKEVESFFAYPASDDGGTSIGSAILGYLELCKRHRTEPKLELPRHMYLGLQFSEQEMEAAIRTSGVSYERMVNSAKQIAALLVEGRVIARFFGREEVGPRALGNRSILADPRDLKIIRRINFAIKHRDFWMPFAPSILEEEATKYLKNLSEVPYYMIDAFDTTPLAMNAIVAGMHPHDLTARPQVVNDLNPEYRQIIREFRSLTGVGALLNTSFNLHGYPIVGSPEVALETLKKSDLDGLALGPFLVMNSTR